MNLDKRAKRVAIDRLGELVERMQDTARAQRCLRNCQIRSAAFSVASWSPCWCVLRKGLRP